MTRAGGFKQKWPDYRVRGATIRLRHYLALLLLSSSLMTDGWAQRKNTIQRTPRAVVTMRSEATGTLSVSLMSAPDGLPLNGGSSSQRTLNFERVSYNMAPAAPNVSLTRRPASFVVATRFGLSIQDPSQHIARATVLAAMAVPEAQFSFRLDGIQLGTTPQMVQRQAKVGLTTDHLLEIEVPISITEKNSHLQNAIFIQVIAN